MSQGNLQQTLLKIVNRLGSDQRKFIAEVTDTFIVVVFATGSVIIDAKMDGARTSYLISYIACYYLSYKLPLQGDQFISR
jgi:hypothetical protein